MCLGGDGRAGNARAAIAPQIEIVLGLPAAFGRVGEIAQRLLLWRIGDTRQQGRRTKRAAHFDIGFGEIGESGTSGIHVPGQPDIDRAASERALIAADQIELEIGTAKGAPAGKVRGPGAGVEATFVGDGDAALQRDLFVGLGHAPEAIVGDERDAARYLERRWRCGVSARVLRDGGAGDQRERGGERESIHGIPL